MIRTAAAALVLVLGLAVVPAVAAESPAPVAAPVTAAAADAAALAADTDWSLPAVPLGAKADTRGAMLPALYVSLAALNTYDAMSTRRGLATGAVEANPTMQAVVSHTSSLVAVKALATVGTIVMAEHLWKTHHKGQAIAMMVISNGVMSAVAMHNSSVLNAAAR